MKAKTHLLGFSNITDVEASMIAKVSINIGNGMEQALDDVQLIDKLLTVMHTHHLLNKKRGLKQQLSAVIGNHIGQNPSNLNSKPKKGELK